MLPVHRYGYRYECVAPVAGNGVCALQPVEFRGCPCSDAIGRQFEYQDIQQSALSYQHFPALRDI